MKEHKPQERSGFLKRYAATIKAVAVFLLSLVLFFWMLNNSWVLRTLIDPLTTVVASAAAWTFKLAGQNAVAYGQTVSVNGTTLSIAVGCNGTEALALYLAAVLALPARWNRRLLGIAIGVIGIFIINHIRVVGLFLVAMLRPEFLPQAHHYAGQTFVIVLGMALWLFWAEKYAGFYYPKAPAPAR